MPNIQYTPVSIRDFTNAKEISYVKWNEVKSLHAFGLFNLVTTKMRRYNLPFKVRKKNCLQLMPQIYIS
jgi:hypothetical protein